MQGPLWASFALRPLTAASTPDSKARKGSNQGQDGAAKEGKDALTLEEEEMNAITDQIPQRPMGVVEGTSYTLVIIAGIALAGTFHFTYRIAILQQPFLAWQIRTADAVAYSSLQACLLSMPGFMASCRGAILNERIHPVTQPPSAHHSRVKRAFAVAVLWAVVNELLIQPREYTAFNLSLQKLRDDPRIMVMIGTPISGYGQETHNRAARQRIPHKVYSDDRNREHVQVIASGSAAAAEHNSCEMSMQHRSAMSA